MKNQLFLCSSSESRKRLLKEANIPFTSIAHHANEESFIYKNSLSKLVLQIAQAKEASINRSFLNEEKDQKKRFFFLSADTLVQGSENKKIYSKPIDLKNAEKILKEIQNEPLLLATGCTLSGYHYNNEKYECFFYEKWATKSKLLFSVPTNEIDTYLKRAPAALSATGAITVENEGAQYLAWIKGSYSNVMGLPLFELKQKLYALGFFYF